MQVLKNALTIQFTRPTKSDYPKAGPGEWVFLKSDQLVLLIHQVGDLQSQGHCLAFILWCSLDLKEHQTTCRRAGRLYELNSLEHLFYFQEISPRPCVSSPLFFSRPLKQTVRDSGSKRLCNFYGLLCFTVRRGDRLAECGSRYTHKKVFYIKEYLPTTPVF